MADWNQYRHFPADGTLGLIGLQSVQVHPDAFWLLPEDVIRHGAIWQLVTYSFLHVGFWHWFGNMLGLWMFGSAIESAWGTRRFLELYLIGVAGAAVTTVALSYAHVLGDPNVATIGASGGVFAILIAFGILFGDSEIMMIPFPFLIKAKYFVGILIVVTLALAMAGGGDVAYVAHLGGLFFGWLYVRRGPKPALVNVGFAERYYGMRNSYTAGSGGGRRRSLKSTCRSMTARSTSTSMGITFRRMTSRAKGMAVGSRGGSTKNRGCRS